MAYSVLDYLEESVAKYPDKIAFADADSSVSFSELQIQARKIGSALATRLAPRTPVVFCMEKSVNTIIGFMGAVTAGCFLCPARFFAANAPLDRNAGRPESGHPDHGCIRRKDGGPAVSELPGHLVRRFTGESGRCQPAGRGSLPN